MRAVLLVRLLVETLLGLLCMATLLLLPGIWRGTFPQTLLLGYLGMPRRYHRGLVSGIHLDVAAALTSLLVILFTLAVGASLLNDARRVFQRLRQQRRTAR